MSSPNSNTFDLVPPRRPGLNDFEGAALTDDVEQPPNPGTDPTSAVWNTICRTLTALGMTAPVLCLGITGHVTQPFINAMACVVSAVTQTPVVGGVFGTFTITRNSIGNVSITWPAGTFPAAAFPPTAFLNAPAAGMVTAFAIANGVTVITMTSAGALADLPFTVDVG